MHEYTVKSHNRPKIIYFIATLAAVISGLIVYFIDSFEQWSTISLVPPSGLLVFLGVFFLFDKFLWKIPLLRRVGAVNIPDLSGAWEGVVASHQSKNKHPIKMTVHQSYTSINIRFEGKPFYSLSKMASITMPSPDQYELRWEYFAEAKDGYQEEKFRHYGVTVFRFEVEKNSINGEHHGYYYTEKDRSTSGTITLRLSEN